MEKNKFRLPKEFTEKWLVALRSNEYIQDKTGHLSTMNDDNYYAYCCLGVGCVITGTKKEKIEESALITSEYLDDDVIDEILESGYPKELMYESNLVTLFASINDGTTYRNEVHGDYKFRKEYTDGDRISMNFVEIANFIEDNVEMYEL